MTVEDLIKKLQELPPYLPIIMMADLKEDFSEIKDVETRYLTVKNGIMTRDSKKEH
jgi:hypothetical protein